MNMQNLAREFDAEEADTNVLIAIPGVLWRSIRAFALSHSHACMHANFRLPSINIGTECPSSPIPPESPACRVHFPFRPPSPLQLHTRQFPPFDLIPSIDLSHQHLLPSAPPSSALILSNRSQLSSEIGCSKYYESVMLNKHQQSTMRAAVTVTITIAAKACIAAAMRIDHGENGMYQEGPDKARSC